MTGRMGVSGKSEIGVTRRHDSDYQQQKKTYGKGAKIFRFSGRL
jgi:hypothetical protein